MPTSLPISAFADEPIRNQSKATLINVFLAWTNAFCLIFALLRVITRRCIVGARLWWDDWFIIAATTGTIVGWALDMVEVHYAFGRPEKYVNEHQLHFFGAYTYVEWIQTFFTLGCTKVSLCFFLLRIPTSQAYIRPLQASIVVLLVSHVIFLFIWIFQCWPVEAAWDDNINGRCHSRTFLLKLVLAHAIISAISDFALALTPIIILRQVTMRIMQKIGLCVLMGLGVIVGVCCVIRTVLNDGALPLDATFGGITNWFWRLFEVQLGIICACIPPLIPGYKWVKQRLNRSLYGTSGDEVSFGRNGEGVPFEAMLDSPARNNSKPYKASDGSVVPRSEKALMGKILDRDRSPMGLRMERNSDPETGTDFSSDGPSSSLRTFYSPESDEKLSQFPQFPPEAHTGPRIVPAVSAQARAKLQAQSFSRRDLEGQSPFQLSQADSVTSPRLGYPVMIPGSAQTVTATGNPHHSLDVNLEPRFDRNRRAFSRVLELRPHSWMSWFSGSSARSGRENDV